MYLTKKQLIDLMSNLNDETPVFIQTPTDVGGLEPNQWYNFHADTMSMKGENHTMDIVLLSLIATINNK